MFTSSATLRLSPSNHVIGGSGDFNLLTSWHCLKQDMDAQISRAKELDDTPSDALPGKGHVDCFERTGSAEFPRTSQYRLQYDPATGATDSFEYLKRNLSSETQNSRVSLSLTHPRQGVTVYEARVVTVSCRDGKLDGHGQLAESVWTATQDEKERTVTITGRHDGGPLSWRQY